MPITFAADTSIGVLGLVGFIIALVIVIVVFVAAQVAEEHGQNLDAQRRLRDHR